MEISGLPENRDLRKKRIRAIAVAAHDRDLSEFIKTEQIKGSLYLAQTLQIAKDRGWIKPDVDLLAASYWIQGLFMGHIMLDITGIKDLDKAWNSIAVDAIRSFINA
jgi:hypothetical protein